LPILFREGCRLRGPVAVPPPREWTNDPSRRAEAGVPEELTFANKIELAKRMLQRAFAAGIPAQWVVADSFYGRSHEFRKWLEERGRPYAVMVPTRRGVDGLG
jgi:SRSO17 transposase